MSSARKRWFLLLKCVLAGVILAAVGWKFYDLLRAPELAHRTALRVEFLIPAGLLYLGCHTLWGTFWWQLLRDQGVRVPWLTAVRAYFVSQAGKYVPGKAWVIFLRVGLLRSGRRPAHRGDRDRGLRDAHQHGGRCGTWCVCLLPWSGLTESR